MSNSLLNIQVALDPDAATVAGRISNSQEKTLELAAILQDIACGIVKGKVMGHVEHTATAAAQTIAFDSSAGSDGDTITIGDIVFTVRSSPEINPIYGEYLLYADDDDSQGEDFAAAWNAHPDARHLGIAVNSSGTVTITLREGGTFGNLLSLATSNASFATLGAAVFAAGAAGTTQLDVFVDSKFTRLL